MISVKKDDMEKATSIWYLPSENTWKDFDIMAMKDIGTLIFESEELVFKGDKYEVSIKEVLSIFYGKQGRDFINNWIKIEYKSENGEIKTAFFADGEMMGWIGIFGGTKRLLKKIKNQYLK